MEFQYVFSLVQNMIYIAEGRVLWFFMICGIYYDVWLYIRYVVHILILIKNTSFLNDHCFTFCNHHFIRTHRIFYGCMDFQRQFCPTKMFTPKRFIVLDIISMSLFSRFLLLLLRCRHKKKSGFLKYFLQYRLFSTF